MFKSTKATIALSCCLVFVMTLFVSVGYATVFETLSITGSAEYQKEPALIYIVNAEVSDYNKNNVTGVPSVEKTSPYVMEIQKTSVFTLGKQETDGNWWNPQVTKVGGWVTIEVTVKNNSGRELFFAGYETGFDSGSVELEYSIKLNTAIAHGDDLTFTITIKNVSDSGLTWSDEQKGIVKFNPDFTDITETVTEGVAEQFTKLLKNEITVEYKGNTLTGTQILNELFVMGNGDNSGLAKGSNTGDYIGNVGAAEDDQHEIMDAIFGDATKMVFGNTTYDVWFLIKRQEVDGKNTSNSSNNSNSSANQAQNDLVLYITVDPLEVGGGSTNNTANMNFVPVFAIVYMYNPSGDANNKYIQCNHLFAGEAPVCDLDGNFGTNLTGNFHTHYWETTEFDRNIVKDTGTDDGALNEAFKHLYPNGYDPSIK